MSKLDDHFRKEAVLMTEDYNQLLERCMALTAESARKDEILDACGIAIFLCDCSDPEIIKLERVAWQKAVNALDTRDYISSAKQETN